MPGDTRTRLIDTAGRRFYREGFRSCSLDAILDDVGISKTAFYKHFESKDDLAVAVLDAHKAEMEDQFRRAVHAKAGTCPVSQLRALFDVVEMHVEDAGFTGCIFINAAMEYPGTGEPCHAAAARAKRAVEDFMTDLARGTSAADPRRLARELCLVMEGAYVTRQVTGDRRTPEVARAVADAIIERHLGAALARVSA